MNRKKHDILYKKVGKPIFDMALMYESSATFVENHLVDKRVVKAFSELKEALSKQFEELRK